LNADQADTAVSFAGLNILPLRTITPSNEFRDNDAQDPAFHIGRSTDVSAVLQPNTGVDRVFHQIPQHDTEIDFIDANVRRDIKRRLQVDLLLLLLFIKRH
jgi:hypothetical protein